MEGNQESVPSSLILRCTSYELLTFLLLNFSNCSLYAVLSCVYKQTRHLKRFVRMIPQTGTSSVCLRGPPVHV